MQRPLPPTANPAVLAHMTAVQLAASPAAFHVNAEQAVHPLKAPVVALDVAEPKKPAAHVHDPAVPMKPGVALQVIAVQLADPAVANEKAPQAVQPDKTPVVRLALALPEDPAAQVQAPAEPV